MNLFTVIIGIERNGSGQQLDPNMRAKACSWLRAAAAAEFGGYTLSHAEGGWKNDAGELITEGVFRLDVYTPHNAKDCHDFAQRVRAMFARQCVVIEWRPAPGMQFADAVSKAVAS